MLVSEVAPWKYVLTAKYGLIIITCQTLSSWISGSVNWMRHVCLERDQFIRVNPYSYWIYRIFEDHDDKLKRFLLDGFKIEIKEAIRIDLICKIRWFFSLETWIRKQIFKNKIIFWSDCIKETGDFIDLDVRTFNLWSNKLDHLVRKNFQNWRNSMVSKVAVTAKISFSIL